MQETRKSVNQGSSDPGILHVDIKIVICFSPVTQHCVSVLAPTREEKQIAELNQSPCALIKIILSYQTN